MAPSKTRLGRGLGSLISSGTTTPKAGSPVAKPQDESRRSSQSEGGPHASAAPDGLPGYREVPMNLIEPNPYQPRKEFDPEALTELVESIRAEGLLQPIVVRAEGEKFQLIAGERRWRAFQQLKIKSIPARIMSSTNASSATLAMIENLQRADLSPIEEAHGYASLICDFDLTQEAAAQRVGKGRATVANSLRLLGLEADIQAYLGKKLLSTGHAKVLLGIEGSPDRLLLARRCIEDGLSVRALEELVQHKRGSSAGPGKKRRMPATEATAISDIEKRLISHLGARVTLRHSPKRGRIIVEYQGNEDLERVLEKMGVKL